ncbi:MAG: amidase [Actinomycetota bacterium]|nr:amidase [Actinomycetota bacterium]
MTPGTEIAAQVRTGRLQALDVVTEALERAAASQGTLNAFTLIDEEGALARARGIDRLVADGRDPGPLAGVPVGLKDLIDQTGLPNTKGAGFPTSPAEHSATVVRRLGAAGAVIIGRTGLHEFAFGFTSENHWFGPVRNPWDPDTSPGGSSGGSGAAVAAGVVPVAIGTDTGGSVRVPAALCGVFGLKVTHGRVPLTGVYPLAPSLDTVGPIAATVADLAACYLVIAGDDPEDPWSQPVPVEALPPPPDPSTLRLGVVKQWFALPHTREVAAGLDHFLHTAGNLGVDIVEVDEPHLTEDAAAARAFGPQVVAVHGERFSADPDAYGPDTRVRIADAYAGTVEDLMAAIRWRAQARAVIGRLFTSGIDVLIAPTVGGMRKVIGDEQMDLDGESVPHRTLLASFTAPINQIGAPSLAAPIPGTGTPPVSVQLIGPMWGEARLLATASALEACGVLASGEPEKYFGKRGRRSGDVPHVP